MKKIIITSALLLASLSSFAQFGITGGLTSSSSDISSASAELRSGNLNQYHFGVCYKFSLGNIFALQPALLYNVKGAQLSTIGGVKDFDFKTGYLELPVQVQAGVGLGKIARLYGVAEPFIGYAISNSVKSGDTASFNFDNIKQRFEYGLGLGVGAELFRHLQVSVRYCWNFGTIYGGEVSFADVKAQISEGKCRGLNLSAVVLF